MDEGLKARTDALGRSLLFSYFTKQELGVVLGVVRERPYRKGEVVFTEGDEGSDLYIVAEGLVVISKAVKEDLEQVLAHLGPGEHFGEMAILENIPRTATATAEQDSTLLVMSEADMFRMMDEYPKAAAKLMFNLLRTFTRRLQSANEQVRDAVRWGLDATGYQVEG